MRGFCNVGFRAFGFIPCKQYLLCRRQPGRRDHPRKCCPLQDLVSPGNFVLFRRA